MRARLRRLLPLLALAALAAGVARAEGESVVFWPLVTDGAEYRRVPYPAEAGPLAVLADTAVVVEARAARTAFWPITREYLSDVSRSSPRVEGRLELVATDGSVTEAVPEPYLLWHPEGVGAGPAELIRGPRVTEVYEAYLRDARAAAEAEQLHQRLVAEHHAAVEAWLKIAAERPANLPPPPPEFQAPPPEPYRAFATEPDAAAILTLPEGRYTLRLRGPEGGVVPGSEREVVSFAPLAEGIGYVLRPGDRWTQPAVSFAPGATIYTTGRDDIFVQPVPVAEYRSRQFTRLFRPQSHEAADPFLTVWVPRPAAGASGPPAGLALWDGGTQLETLPTTPFRVAQTPGRARGYTIEEFAPAGGPLQPDFFAMRVGRDLPVSAISLVADAPVPASERRFRRVAPPADAWLFLPAFVPLLAGLLAKLWLRRPARRAGGRAAFAPLAASARRGLNRP